jgi:hypothetical protein
MPSMRIARVRFQDLSELCLPAVRRPARDPSKR